jgi:hypothetical protein
VLSALSYTKCAIVRWHEVRARQDQLIREEQFKQPAQTIAQRLGKRLRDRSPIKRLLRRRTLTDSQSPHLGQPPRLASPRLRNVRPLRGSLDQIDGQHQLESRPSRSSTRLERRKTVGSTDSGVSFRPSRPQEGSQGSFQGEIMGDEKEKDNQQRDKGKRRA